MPNRVTFIAALAAVAAIGLAAPSQAQYAATSAQVTALPALQSQTRAPAPAAPVLFHLFGMPVQLSAPVPPPYSSAAYETFGGQPATGADRIMSQSFTGQAATPQPN